MKKTFTDFEGVLGKRKVTHALTFWVTIPKLKEYYYKERQVKFKALCCEQMKEGPEQFLSKEKEVTCKKCLSSFDHIEDLIARQFK